MTLHDHRLQVVAADITQLAVDAVVNAANETLLGGSGVDGAIHRAAGPELLAHCASLPQVRPGCRCPTGEARLTPGFGLPARHIIHTVGPVWRGGRADEAELLGRCYRSVFALARRHGLSSLAFPAISCGVYGYPHRRAAAIAVTECRRQLEDCATLEIVQLVAFSAEMADVLEEALHRTDLRS